MKIDHLTLNFLDQYYMFYEWLESDNIEKYHHIKLYKVCSKTISEFINHKFKMDCSFIIEGPICFSDGYSFIAVEFDKEGNSLYKSSLYLEDELKLNNAVDSLKVEKLNYELLELDNQNNDLRINEVIRKTIKVEINNIIKTKNLDKLQYLYYEWFKKRESNFNKMIKIMQKKLEMPLTEKEKLVFELIKKSYKLV